MKPFYLTFLLSVFFGLSLTNAQESIDDTRTLLGEWVETRQLISEEQQDWRVEKSILTETRTLLGNELNRLQESIEELESTATAADEERSELTKEKDELKTASKTVAAQIVALEDKTKKLLPLFPEPLIERIKPLIRRLPENPKNAEASLGERVQNIVGILSQANKFNNTLTLTSETRTINNSKEVQVNTLYWGLAMAYYVDASGNYAGISYPAADGWQTALIEGSGPQIKKLIGVYEGDDAIQFVKIPAQIH